MTSAGSSGPNLARTATLVLLAGAAAVWLAGAATSPAPPATALPSVKGTHDLDARSSALNVEAARLRERLRPTAAPHEPGRNLFAFRDKPIAHPPAVVPTVLPQHLASRAPAPPPSYRLIGLAEDPEGTGGAERTAIISGSGELYLVKAGDSVTARYRVSRVDADGVELVDAVDGRSFRLTLK
jgi:hypothetical protein